MQEVKDCSAEDDLNRPTMKASRTSVIAKLIVCVALLCRSMCVAADRPGPKSSTPKGNAVTADTTMQSPFQALMQEGAKLLNDGDIGGANKAFSSALSNCNKRTNPIGWADAYVMFSESSTLDGDPERATQEIKEAVAIYERHSGVDDVRLALALNQLARLDLMRASMNQYSTAALIDRALKIEERAHGADCIHVTRLLKTQAKLLDRYPTAGTSDEPLEELLQKILQIDEKWLGADHITIERDLQALSVFYRKHNQRRRAVSLQMRRVEILEKAYKKGTPNPRDACMMLNWALFEAVSLFEELGDPSEVEPLLQRALAAAEETYGKGHRELSYPLNKLMQFHETQNRFSEAALSAELLLQMEEKHGKESFEAAARLRQLAGLHRRGRHFDEAAKLYQRVLSLYDAIFGNSDHVPSDVFTLYSGKKNGQVETETVLQDLVATYLEARRPTEAESASRQLLKLRFSGWSAPRSVSLALAHLAPMLQPAIKKFLISAISSETASFQIEIKNPALEAYSALVIPISLTECRGAMKDYHEALKQMGVSYEVSSQRVGTIIMGQDPGELIIR